MRGLPISLASVLTLAACAPTFPLPMTATDLVRDGSGPDGMHGSAGSPGPEGEPGSVTIEVTP